MTGLPNRPILHSPPMPSPPSIPPTVDCIAPSTLRAASFTAAKIKSCSISTSPDFTASGSMRILSSCFRPSIFAVTVPPPDEASTTVSCIFFCRVSYCDFAFDISSCRLNPPIDPRLPASGAGLPEQPETGSRMPVFLPFLLIVDHGPNLGPEFLPQTLHHLVLLRPAPPRRSRVHPARSRRRPHACAVPSFRRGHAGSGNDLQLHGSPQNTARRSYRQPSRLCTD